MFEWLYSHYFWAPKITTPSVACRFAQWIKQPCDFFHRLSYRIYRVNICRSMSSGGWCGRGDRPRVFPKQPPVICYDSPPAARVNCIRYDDLRLQALMGKRVLEITVPKKSAATWEMKEGELCRITVIEGSQVGFCRVRIKACKHCSSRTRQFRVNWTHAQNNLHLPELTLYISCKAGMK